MRALLSFLPVTFGTTHCRFLAVFLATVVALLATRGGRAACGSRAAGGRGAERREGDVVTGVELPAAFEMTMRAW